MLDAIKPRTLSHESEFMGRAEDEEKFKCKIVVQFVSEKFVHEIMQFN